MVCVGCETNISILVGKVLCKSLEVTFNGNFAQLSPAIRRALGIYELDEDNQTIHEKSVSKYRLSMGTKGDYWISRDTAEKYNWKGKVILLLFILI